MDIFEERNSTSKFYVGDKACAPRDSRGLMQNGIKRVVGTHRERLHSVIICNFLKSWEFPPHKNQLQRKDCANGIQGEGQSPSQAGMDLGRISQVENFSHEE